MSDDQGIRAFAPFLPNFRRKGGFVEAQQIAAPEDVPAVAKWVADCAPSRVTVCRPDVGDPYLIVHRSFGPTDRANVGDWVVRYGADEFGALLDGGADFRVFTPAAFAQLFDPLADGAGAKPARLRAPYERFGDGPADDGYVDRASGSAVVTIEVDLSDLLAVVREEAAEHLLSTLTVAAERAGIARRPKEA